MKAWKIAVIAVFVILLPFILYGAYLGFSYLGSKELQLYSIIAGGMAEKSSVEDLGTWAITISTPWCTLSTSTKVSYSEANTDCQDALALASGYNVVKGELGDLPRMGDETRYVYVPSDVTKTGSSEWTAHIIRYELPNPTMVTLAFLSVNLTIIVSIVIVIYLGMSSYGKNPPSEGDARNV